MGGPPCPPFSPCWCETHPTHPKCSQVGVPIDGGIEFLLIAGLILGIWSILYNKKIKQS